MSHHFTERANVLWSRDEITSCECNEKSYRHVHCPCYRCDGRATDRKTELRHWRETCELEACNSASVHNSDSTIDSHISDDILVEDGDGYDNNNDELSEDENGTGSDPEPQPRKHPQSSGIQDDNINVNQNPMKKLVVKAVLDALRIKHQSGVSVKTFEDVLEYGKSLLFTSLGEDVDVEILTTLWPKSWNDVQLLLKEEGYEDVKEYFICFCREEKEFTRDGRTTKKFVYDGKYSLMESKHDKCLHCGNAGYIKYLYLGLENKVKNWFRNKTMCKKMLAHWSEREHWLENIEGWQLKKEIWDGKRWEELQWFWNPDSVWALPTRCVHCYIPISADHLINSPDQNGLKIVECPVCFENFEHCIKMTKGSPLNLALIGHFDGWQPFGTSYRGSGSLEVTIANMEKTERNHVDEVYVAGFVPCFEVPNLPEALDPFLQPLMNDLCKGFIQGFQVNYPEGITIPGYELAKEETVRLLLLCWTADHPGQCETGKFLNQGRCACRRCKMVGQHLENNSNTHYYYGQNRFHYRYPWGQRIIESELGNLFDIENETRSSVRKRMSSEKGFTGVSIFHKYLYPLYGFDILNHLVYDVYHTIPLNVVKNQLVRLLDLEMLDKTKLDKQIENFPWTDDFKDGRLPKQLGKDCKGIGYWKAESFQKFSFPMAECVMGGQVANPKEYEIVSLVSRLTELHFHDGRNGWTPDMIKLHQNLAWRLNIQVEEVQGLAMCTISLHNLLHIHEDILNFSAPDNVWCAVFERAVKEYVKKSHNGKSIEATFAHVEAIREYLKSVEERDETSPGKHDVLLGIAGSNDTAKALSQMEPPPRGAFLVGSMTNIKPIEGDDRNKIAELLSVSPFDVPMAAFATKRCFKADIGFDGTGFACGDKVIVSVNGQEAVVQLQGFLSVRSGGDFYSLLGQGVHYPSHLRDNGEVDINYWSGFVKVECQPLPNSIVFLVKDIRRKVILYPCECDQNLLTVVDYMRQLRYFPYALVVPVYPEIGDMMLIQGESNEDIWHGHIQSVDLINKTVDVFFFVPSLRFCQGNIYVREIRGRGARNTVAWESMIEIAEGHWHSPSTWEKAI